MAQNKSKKVTELSKLQLIAQRGGECQKCHRLVPRLTVEHIIPVAFIKTLDSTGDLIYEWLDNMELLCHACNAFKASHIDKTNPKTLPLLIEIVIMLKKEQEASIGLKVQ